MLWFHNRLSGSPKTVRTDSYQPEFTVSFNAPFKRDNATLDLRLGLDRRMSADTNVADRNIGINYRDIIGATDLDLSLEHAWFDTRPYDSGNKNNEFNATLTLGTRIQKGDALWRPNITIGSRRNRNVLEAYSDRMWEYSLGIGYDVPNQGFTSNLRIGQKYNTNGKAGVDSSQRWFASLDMEAKPRYLAWISPNAKHYLRIGINDYKFDSAGNNYRETSIVTGIKVDI